MDRKEITRQYKETARRRGFSGAERRDGKIVFGSTTDCLRCSTERFQLEHGSHADRELQKDWNEAGADSFNSKFSTN